MSATRSRLKWTSKDFPVFLQYVLAPAMLIILVIVLGIYGINYYLVNSERQLSSELNAVVDDFNGIEFEAGTLAYEEELRKFVGRFNEIYAGASGSDNGKRALYHAGMTYYVLGDFVEAEKSLRQLFEQDKKFYLSSQALYYSALALEELERYQDALSALSIYEEIYADSTFLTQEVILAQARNYAWLEDYEKAAEYCRELIGVEDEQASASSLLAQALERDEDSVAAVYREKAQELLDLIELNRRKSTL